MHRPREGRPQGGALHLKAQVPWLIGCLRIFLLPLLTAHGPQRHSLSHVTLMTVSENLRATDEDGQGSESLKITRLLSDCKELNLGPVTSHLVFVPRVPL